MTGWTLPSADDLKGVTALLAIAAVAGGGVVIAADIIWLSPRVASVISYADFFRALPTAGGLYLVSTASVAAFGSMLFLRDGPEARARVATIAGMMLSGIIVIWLGADVPLSPVADALLRSALLLSTQIALAGVSARLMHRFPAILFPAGLPGAVLLVTLFWRPLDAPPDVTDRLCMEARDACFETDLLRVYQNWIVHRPEPGQLEFVKLDGVAASVIGRRSP